jgi:PIN domain nuclease of toxin-antitoxin system
VLDASAILAVIRNERGASEVLPLLHSSMISAVNFTEVLKRGQDKGGSPAVTRALFSNVGIPIVAFDEQQAVLCAELAATTQELGLSLADRACLALGVISQTKVITADQRMSRAKLPIEIILIRQPN